VIRSPGAILAGSDVRRGTTDEIASWRLGRDVTDLVRGSRWHVVPQRPATGPAVLAKPRPAATALAKLADVPKKPASAMKLERTARRPRAGGESMNRIVAIVLIGWSFAAFAQPAGAQAEVLFRRGRDLLAAGKVAEACSAFEESQKLEPAVTTLLNLAGCREKMGQFATAWGLFLDVARQTRSATDAQSQRFHQVAQARAQKLEPRVSKLTVNVPPQSQIGGLEIVRGADRVNAAMWNSALPVDGGTYTITARAPGESRWSTQVTVANESDAKTVEVPDLRNLPRGVDKPDHNPPRDLDKAAAPPSLPPVAATLADQPSPDHPLAPAHASSKIVELGVGVGALALLGGGLGLELWAESTYHTATSETTSQPLRDSLYSSANTRRYAAEALAVTGFAATGVAVWLYLRNDSRKRYVTTSASVHVVPTTRGLALLRQF
jgi:hypothetical protein